MHTRTAADVDMCVVLASVAAPVGAVGGPPGGDGTEGAQAYRRVPIPLHLPRPHRAALSFVNSDMWQSFDDMEHLLHLVRCRDLASQRLSWPPTVSLTRALRVCVFASVYE